MSMGYLSEKIRFSNIWRSQGQKQKFGSAKFLGKVFENGSVGAQKMIFGHRYLQIKEGQRRDERVGTHRPIAKSMPNRFFCSAKVLATNAIFCQVHFHPLTIFFIMKWFKTKTIKKRISKTEKKMLNLADDNARLAVGGSLTRQVATILKIPMVTRESRYSVKWSVWFICNFQFLKNFQKNSIKNEKITKM